MGRESLVKEEIRNLSLGIFNTLVDFSLFLFAFWAQSYSVGSGRRDLFKALENSSDFVKAVRGHYLKRGIYRATEKGFLIKRDKNWEITGFGKKRLKEILPKYHSNRPWDGKIYLVTYDIPETKKKDRELLRLYLKRIGCGMFQASVWLTPYNPRKVLAEFIEEHKLSGLVVVSDIGKDGNVGQMPIGGLLSKVYKLDNLNERYREFLKRVEKGVLNRWEINFQFLSILKDDPQLPFTLLSQDWLGEEAYKVFRFYIFDRRPQSK